LSLVGGWPGALVAQQKLRHKSQKQSFRIVFWITVLLNCAAFSWLFTGYRALNGRPPNFDIDFDTATPVAERFKWKPVAILPGKPEVLYA
jgi:heme/copper-type cytochrome/quinol oxidase subunit 3